VFRAECIDKRDLVTVGKDSGKTLSESSMKLTGTDLISDLSGL
jgi:hypothetical protein